MDPSPAMSYQFTYCPSPETESALVRFYYEQQQPAIEQHPNWVASIYPEKKLCYFTSFLENRIFCTAVIEEYSGGFVSTANISFGPLTSDPKTTAICIGEIYAYYRKKRFALLTIQPEYIPQESAEILENLIKNKLPVQYLNDSNNWTSISIDLSRSEDEVMKAMSKGHKSDIKKAAKSGLNVLSNFTSEQFEQFTSIFTKMHRERKLAEPANGFESFLKDVKKKFESSGSGKFLLVANADQKILGGIALIYQGSVVRYFKGAADPEVRNLPVLHLAIWEGIRSSAAKGFKQFDLWGYNHFAKESEQVFFINRFKKGFGGDFIYYPKKMYFILNPFRYRIFQTAQKMYRFIKSR